jgi:hypothetical protein
VRSIRLSATVENRKAGDGRVGLQQPAATIVVPALVAHGSREGSSGCRAWAVVFVSAKNEKAPQCEALKLVGPHGLEPWTKGL